MTMTETKPHGVDYDKLNNVVRRQRTALTRAINSKDRDKIVAACRDAVTEWNGEGMAWPDDWSRWQRALNNAFQVFEAPRLEDLEIDLPECVRVMGCFCAGHARGNPASDMCDTREIERKPIKRGDT